MSLTNDFLQQRIDRAKAIIVDAETALERIATGAIDQYTVDTGQSRTTVTKSNIQVLENIIDSQLNRLSMLEARMTGSNVVVGRPGW